LAPDRSDAFRKEVKMEKKLFLIFMLFSLLIVQTVYAECEKCSDSRLACTGDSEGEFLKKCGQPTKAIPYENVWHQIVRVDYYYDLGGGRFLRIFTFQNGALSTIQTSK